MTKAGLALVVAAGLVLGACRSLGADEAPRPALLVNPDAAARAELLAAVDRELHVATPVLIADDALTRTSELIIERALARAANGLPLDGRERVRPERFSLRLVGKKCVLEHAGGAALTLVHSRCIPTPP